MSNTPQEMLKMAGAHLENQHLTPSKLPVCFRQRGEKTTLFIWEQKNVADELRTQSHAERVGTGALYRELQECCPGPAVPWDWYVGVP